MTPWHDDRADSTVVAGFSGDKGDADDTRLVDLPVASLWFSTCVGTICSPHFRFQDDADLMLAKYVKHRIRRFRLQLARFGRRAPCSVTRLGGKHGWPVCRDFVNADSVVYSFGVGDNVAWDLAMIEQCGVQVQAFDPTPESIAWVARQSFPEQFRFHDYGIAAFDGELNFYPPKAAGRMHFSQDRQRFNAPGQATFAGRVYRLSTIARQLGHSRIDVLKLDVEGTEFDCIPDLLASGLEIGQLLVEVHYVFPSRSFREGVALLKRIETAGFECFDISERGLEFGFIHRRLVADLAARTGPDQASAIASL